MPSRVRLREGPIGVRITQGQPTIGYLYPWVGFRPPAFVSLLSCSSSCAIEALWASVGHSVACIPCATGHVASVGGVCRSCYDTGGFPKGLGPELQARCNSGYDVPS